MNKKISAGAVVSCIVAVLAIVSLVMYTMGVGAAGYFQGAEVLNLTMYAGLAIAALVLAVVLSMVKVNGMAGKLVAIVTGALQIAAPVLLALCLINLVAARAEGLGFIYFSNADVAKEVQTAENLASATNAIATMVAFAVSMVAGWVAAFFSVKKA